MAMNMDALLRIKADVQGENNIRRLGNSLQGLQGQAKNAALGFNNLKGAVAGFGAAIAGSAIVAGLGAIVKKSIDAGGELDDLRQKTGVSAAALFAIGNAAKVAGVDMDTVGKGLGKLNINLVKAAEGNEDLAQKFKRLGVDVKDAKGQVVPADKALKQIADRFADMPDGAQKAAAAVALFGKGGADLIPLLNEGAAGLERFKSKLTPKEFEEFTKRSDLFGESLTELGIKTQGFGLELTDALLPALQSILEVFADLFDTKQDWTALFKVITVGIRIVATVIYAMVKLVDQLAKAVVYTFDAIRLAVQGDFEGAGRIISQNFGAGLEQAKRDFAQIQKIFTDSPAPKATTRDRPQTPDTSAADTAGAAAARKAASEQERLLEQRAALMKRGEDLEEQLRRSVQDVTLSTQVVTASPVKQLELNGKKAIIESARQVKDLRKTVTELMADFEKAGGSLVATPFFDLINQLSNANVALINKTYQQDFAELYASQGEAIDKATESVYENARALQYNNDVMGGLKDGLTGYIEQIGTMRDALSNLGQQAFKGIEDALVSLVTTGTANFREFAVSILEETSRMIIQQLVLKQIMQAIGFGGGGGGGGGAGFTQFNASSVGFNPLAFSGISFANGGIMTGDGPMPLKKYASGGIANSPQLALYGEGSRPEAFVPLPDGRRIPVAMQGGGGGSTNVTVNVDASGNASVQGDQAQAKQLGVAVSAAVQAELVKQQRPGGLLAGTRR
jgi:lambda family phage tail tape measure protein